MVNGLPVLPGGVRRTGQAMSELYKLYLCQITKNSHPNFVFAIVNGKSQDADILPAIGDKFRRKGIKVMAFAPNLQAKIYLDELTKIVYKSPYIIYGDKKSIITPDRFTAITSIITQGAYVMLSLADYIWYDLQRGLTLCQNGKMEIQFWFTEKLDRYYKIIP